jgi:hypothetical protein
MCFARIAAHPRRREGQHGPKPLAAGIDEMPRQVGDQRNGAPQPVVDYTVGRCHVAAEKGIQMVNRLQLRAAGLPNCLGHTHSHKSSKSLAVSLSLADIYGLPPGRVKDRQLHGGRVLQIGQGVCRKSLNPTIWSS